MFNLAAEEEIAHDTTRLIGDSEPTLTGLKSNRARRFATVDIIRLMSQVDGRLGSNYGSLAKKNRTTNRRNVPSREETPTDFHESDRNLLR